MLHIVLKSGEEIQWDSTKLFPLSCSQVKDVVEVQANGGELSIITNELSNVPMAGRALVARWFGDHAKFIAGYLSSRDSAVPKYVDYRGPG